VSSERSERVAKYQLEYLKHIQDEIEFIITISKTIKKKALITVWARNQKIKKVGLSPVVLFPYLAPLHYYPLGIT
jgi:hypothetical protein